MSEGAIYVLGWTDPFSRIPPVGITWPKSAEEMEACSFLPVYLVPHSSGLGNIGSAPVLLWKVTRMPA